MAVVLRVAVAVVMVAVVMVVMAVVLRVVVVIMVVIMGVIMDPTEEAVTPTMEVAVVVQAAGFPMHGSILITTGSWSVIPWCRGPAFTIRQLSSSSSDPPNCRRPPRSHLHELPHRVHLAPLHLQTGSLPPWP